MDDSHASSTATDAEYLTTASIIRPWTDVDRTTSDPEVSARPLNTLDILAGEPTGGSAPELAPRLPAVSKSTIDTNGSEQMALPLLELLNKDGAPAHSSQESVRAADLLKAATRDAFKVILGLSGIKDALRENQPAEKAPIRIDYDSKGNKVLERHYDTEGKLKARTHFDTDTGKNSMQELYDSNGHLSCRISFDTKTGLKTISKSYRPDGTVGSMNFYREDGQRLSMQLVRFNDGTMLRTDYDDNGQHKFQVSRRPDGSFDWHDRPLAWKLFAPDDANDLFPQWIKDTLNRKR